LQDSATQSKPLCVSAGMIRQLATADYRTQIKRSYANNALVIGDPDTEGFVCQLPGAAQEAKTVASIISNYEYKVTTKIKGPFAQTLQALFETEYKIIHLAGHGFFESAKKDDPCGNAASDNGGMVIGNNIFLTAKEINQMSQVPEFVFINCCFLGKVDGDAENNAQLHYKLAANIGVQLIEMGVKAVVAAGWAVDDDAALLFSETFYKEMFDGAGFGEAVQQARSQCFEKYPHTNTWGAYQCYGDQFYKFTVKTSNKNKTYNYVIPMEAEIDLVNLNNKVLSGRYTKDEMAAELQQISKAIDKATIRNGTLTEIEARILIGLNQQDTAIDKINALLKFEEADFTVSVLENLCSLNIKTSRNTPEKTEEDVRAIISNFAYLLKIGDTCQRHLLLGTAYKILFLKCVKPADKTDALKKAAAEYRAAYEIARKNNSGLLDPLCTWIQLESLLVLNDPQSNWGKQSVNKYKLPTAKTIEALLDKALEADNDADRDYEFWDLLNHANVLLAKLCLHAGSIKEADIIAAIKKDWKKTGARVKIDNGIEYLQLLRTAIAGTKQPKAKALSISLKKIETELGKELE
jgi:hypothetical protein